MTACRCKWEEVLMVESCERLSSECFFSQWNGKLGSAENEEGVENIRRKGKRGVKGASQTRVYIQLSKKLC